MGRESEVDPTPETTRGAARPAYQQLAERLRIQILDGKVRPGERLPGEADLCDEHGVSRSTVREAIRLLEAQHLVVTTRGTTGGSFVSQHSPDRIGNELGASLDLLVAHDTLTVEQIIEARRLLEVPATALAATRRTEEQLAGLRECLEDGRGGNERFHRLLLGASGNPLLEEMTAPLFGVIRDRVERDRSSSDFWDRVDHDHRELLEHIERRDAQGAADAMGRHLDELQHGYRIAGQD
ncbi:MAG TPA: FadR/GntR family transcriptional regulator [Microthrixaceae bacterium]|nr:FadR/GntR family transcriptional regulator [Microthrixaceae bacterium]